MSPATICRCGTFVLPGEPHDCQPSRQQRAYDNARRNSRPITRARNTPGWRRTAEVVRRRDNETCNHCGAHGRIVDHINPQAGDHPDNLQVLCHRCSGRKDGGRRHAA